jgi:nitroreductase
LIVKHKYCNRIGLLVTGTLIFSLFICNPLSSSNGKIAIHEAGKEAKKIAEKCQDKSNYIADEHQAEILFDIIKHRRTVRAFKDTPVPEQDILKILDMARYAPTAGNQQTWKFVVMRDKQNLKELKKNLKKWTKEALLKANIPDDERQQYIKQVHDVIDRIMTAPVYIFILADTTKYGNYALYDGCLAAENLFLAARALGYGTGFFTTYFPGDKIKQFINAPESMQYICSTPLGVPEEWPKMPQKKGLKEFIVWEKFE